MKNKIKQSLIQPYSKTYQCLCFLNKYLLLGLCCLFLVITSYPLGVHFYLKQQFAHQQQQQITLKDQLAKQTQLLTSLQQHIQIQRENNFSFTQINQQIQTILTKYQTQTEQWQWSLEQENQLYLTFNQQTTSLLNILYELNQIPALYSKEITLTKLHQAKLVQFNGTFMLSN